MKHIDFSKLLSWWLALTAVVFCFGCEERPAPAAPAEVAKSESEQETKPALPELIAATRDREQLKDIPFRDVILAVAGRKILKLEAGSQAGTAILAALTSACQATLVEMNGEQSPVRGLRRINEGSRFFEDALVRHLDAMEEFSCDLPPTAEGNKQRSGYPDLKLIHEPTQTVVYLDPKLFEESAARSQLRSFYFKPRVKTNKVLKDAHHLLIGFRHDGQDGKWRFLGWELVDLHEFRVDLELEFQGSNHDLYRPNLILRSGEPLP